MIWSKPKHRPKRRNLHTEAKRSLLRDGVGQVRNRDRPFEPSDVGFHLFGHLEKHCRGGPVRQCSRKTPALLGAGLHIAND